MRRAIVIDEPGAVQDTVQTLDFDIRSIEMDGRCYATKQADRMSIVEIEERFALCVASHLEDPLHHGVAILVPLDVAVMRSFAAALTTRADALEAAATVAADAALAKAARAAGGAA